MIFVDDIRAVSKVVPRGTIDKLKAIAKKYDLATYENVPDYFEPERIFWFAIDITRVPDDVSVTELVKNLKSDHEFAYGKDCLWFCSDAPTIYRKIVRRKK